MHGVVSCRRYIGGVRGSRGFGFNRLEQGGYKNNNTAIDRIHRLHPIECSGIPIRIRPSHASKARADESTHTYTHKTPTSPPPTHTLYNTHTQPTTHTGLQTHALAIEAGGVHTQDASHDAQPKVAWELLPVFNHVRVALPCVWYVSCRVVCLCVYGGGWVGVCVCGFGSVCPCLVSRSSPAFISLTLTKRPKTADVSKTHRVPTRRGSRESAWAPPCGCPGPVFVLCCLVSCLFVCLFVCFFFFFFN
jgi:hypothetical protein